MTKNPEGSPRRLVPPSTVKSYEFEGFSMDLATYQLLHNGAVVPVTPKAFDTLLMLVQNRHRAVSKEELMSAVWPDAFVSEDSLTQSVSVLRRALGDDPMHSRCIITVARRGYRFIAPVTEVPVEQAGHESAPGIDAAANTTAPPAARGRTVPFFRRWSVAALALLVVAAALLTARQVLTADPPAAAGRFFRFSQTAPPGATLESGGLLSPDGRQIVFIARDNRTGRSQLWVRALTSDESRPLPGTEDAFRPFWSPTNQSLGFFTGGKLKRIDLSTSSIRSIATVTASADPGGTWGAGDVILFSALRAGIYAVSAEGGQARVITTLDQAAQEVGHRHPQFLPDNRHFLYFNDSVRADRRGTWVGSLDPNEPRKRVLDTTSVYAPPGYLLSVRDRALVAQPFDAVRAQLSGSPVAIAGNVAAPDRTNGVRVSVAQDLLSFTVSSTNEHLVWFNRTGARLSQIDTQTVLRNPTFSRDEKRMLLASYDDPERKGLWMMDLERGSVTRLTSDGMRPFESPDGTSIAFVSDRLAGISDIYLRPFGGRGEDAELVYRSDENKSIGDWAPDGSSIVFVSTNAQTNADLWRLPLSGTRRPVPVLRTPANELQGQVSPDGHWIAYTSDESGSWEVYVQSFPEPATKYTVSVGGGSDPHWRRDGRELFYVAADRMMMAVAVNPGAVFQASRPVALFRAPTSGLNVYRTDYAVSADGQRFLVDSIDGSEHDQPLAILVNWLAAVKR